MKHRMIFLSMLIFVITIMVWPTAAADTSLWSDKADGIYQEKEDEYTKGDIITVIIEENSDAVQSANTSTSQGSSAEAGAGTGLFDFITSFGFNYDDEDAAEGQTQRSGQIEADITALIVDVLESGNYKIEGIKKIKINGEEQIIRLTGIIRREDISDENTISSKKVAEASIEFEGKGVVTEKQKPNIFQRILNWIF